jgi:hypothetical protein
MAKWPNGQMAKWPNGPRRETSWPCNFINQRSEIVKLHSNSLNHQPPPGRANGLKQSQNFFHSKLAISYLPPLLKLLNLSLEQPVTWFSEQGSPCQNKKFPHSYIISLLLSPDLRLGKVITKDRLHSVLQLGMLLPFFLFLGQLKTKKVKLGTFRYSLIPSG